MHPPTGLAGRLTVLSLAALVLLAAVPAVAAAAPHLRRGSVRTLSADDDIPGVVLASPLPATGSRTGTLNDENDSDDVYSLPLAVGQTVQLTVTGAPGTDFYVDLYGPDAGHIMQDYPVAVSESDGYPRVVDFTAGTAGPYYADVYTDSGSGAYTLSWHVTDPPVPMSRVAGADRYQTAIQISKATFAKGTTASVVLATGQDFADALAASALAGSYGCPILLTQTATLPAGVLGEIDRLRGATAGTVLVVGSTAAVSRHVEDLLTGHGLAVDRIAGGNRYATAAAIAERVRAHETSAGRSPSSEVFVCNGMNFPDALAVAPYAYSQRMPILLVQPWALPSATASEFATYAPLKAYVVGDTPAVGAAVEASLPVGATERLKGPNRYDTARAVADAALAKPWATPGLVGVVTGRAFPDALGGAALVGSRGGVMLLTEPWYLVGQADGLIHAQRAKVADVRFFGSKKAVFDDVVGDVVYSLTQP